MMNHRRPPRSAAGRTAGCLRTVIVGLFLILATVGVYGQVVGFDFVNYDDTIYVTNNRFVVPGLTLKGLAWAFSFQDKESTYWQPLTWLAHMLDCQLYGLSPGGHHLTSLLLHQANVVLLFLVLQAMTGSLLKSAGVALLFGLHPLNVESVAWIAARKNVVSTLFWMLTLGAYLFYTRRPCVGRYLLVAAALAAGLLAKPMLVTLPAVLLLLDVWPLGRLPWPPASGEAAANGCRLPLAGVKVSPTFLLILEKIPLVGLALASVRLTMLSLQPYGNLAPPTLSTVSLRISNALVSYVQYIGKMVWPRNLAVLYPYPEQIPLWQAAGAGLLLVIVTAAVLLAVRRRPYLAVGWFWFLGTLLPASGLLQGGLWPAMADRFAYVPLIGLFVVVVWGLPDLLASRPHGRIGLGLAAGILAPALMVAAGYQVQTWRNSETLFRRALQVTADNVIAHFQLGLEMERQGKLDEAAEQYARTLALEPMYTPAYTNMGVVMARKGDLRAAGRYYLQAIRLSPTDAGAYNNLGIVWGRQGRTGEAIRAFQQALRLDPNMTASLFNLAWIRATHANPEYRQGREALELAERLCHITGCRQARFLDLLAAAYAEAGRFEQAVAAAQKALEVAGPNESPAIAARLSTYRAGRPYREEAR